MDKLDRPAYEASSPTLNRPGPEAISGPVNSRRAAAEVSMIHDAELEGVEW
jgi:hypothetical protein